MTQPQVTPHVAGGSWSRWLAAGLLALGLGTAACSSPPAAAHPAELAASAASSVRLPPVDADFDYQLGGAYRPGPDVRVVTRDRTARPTGRYDICYLNAFQTQPEDLGWWRRHHPGVLLRYHGSLRHDPGWPGEVLLDTRTAGQRAEIASVMDGWIAGCAHRGFDAVEPDNLDSWTRSKHLLDRDDNLDLARRLARAAHAHGLAIAQKNVAGLRPSLVRGVGFDFAVAEDCAVYSECGDYGRVYGRHVIEIEYSDEGRANFARACAAHASDWSIVYRDRDLVTPAQRGYVRRTC